MLHDMIYNPSTKEHLKRCLMMEPVPNMIFSGPKGSGKYHAALYVAGEFLGIDDPESNAYVHIIHSEKGVITKGKIDAIMEFIAYDSLYRRVCIIDDAELMNDEAQNSLLKVLEDLADRCLIIMVAHDRLLPTIESRCVCVDFHLLSREAVSGFLNGEPINDTAWIASGGVIGTYLTLNEDGFIKKAEELHQAVFFGSKVDLLKACGCLKEKDKEILTELFSIEQMEGLLNLLKSMFVMEYMAKGSGLTIALTTNYVADMAAELAEAVSKNKRNRFHAADLLELLIKINKAKTV